jgi:pyruvate kinase
VARISRKRPSLPILAITPDLQVARRMALMWGAHSVHSEVVHSYEEMVSLAEATVRSEEFAKPGELVVVVAGIPFGQSGSTNNLRVIRIGG